jgi:hypothetical protein
MTTHTEVPTPSTNAPKIIYLQDGPEDEPMAPPASIAQTGRALGYLRVWLHTARNGDGVILIRVVDPAIAIEGIPLGNKRRGYCGLAGIPDERTTNRP